MAAEVLSSVDRRWNDLSRGHRRYLCLQISEYLSSQLGELQNSDFANETEVRKLKQLIGQINIGLANPSRLPVAVKTAAVEGFYIDSAPRSIERLLRSFDPSDRKFFDWVTEVRGANRGRLWTTLDNVTNIRNDIAHGDIDSQPTLYLARNYAMNCAALIRHADVFICECYPDLAETRE